MSEEAESIFMVNTIKMGQFDFVYGREHAVVYQPPVWLFEMDSHDVNDEAVLNGSQSRSDLIGNDPMTAILLLNS